MDIASRPPATSPPRFLQVLVGTQNALGLVTLRGQKVTPLEVHNTAGMYYGITWDAYRFYFVARGAPTNLLSASKDPSGLAAFVDMPAPITTSMDQGIPSPHQCHYNGILWITDTQTCSLLKYDPASMLWGDSVKWGGTQNAHLNSVWGGSTLWVVEHTRDNPYKYIRRLIPGALDPRIPELFDTLTLHLPELQQGSGQQGLHNVYREGESVYTLGPAHVLRIDLVKAQIEIKTLEEVTPKAHYLRGLARIRGMGDGLGDEGDDYFIIGRSNAQAREDRGYGSSALLCYNRDWRLLAKWDLPPSWGQVMEVRGLTHEDRAHNGMTPPHMRKGQKWSFRTWEPTKRGTPGNT